MRWIRSPSTCAFPCFREPISVSQKQLSKRLSTCAPRSRSIMNTLKSTGYRSKIRLFPSKEAENHRHKYFRWIFLPLFLHDTVKEVIPSIIPTSFWESFCSICLFLSAHQNVVGLKLKILILNYLRKIWSMVKGNAPHSLWG